MPNGNKKEAKISNFIVELSTKDDTPKVLLIRADALEQYFQSRYDWVS